MVIFVDKLRWLLSAHVGSWVVRMGSLHFQAKSRKP